MNSIKMILHSGKNPKFPYYVKNYLAMMIPSWVFRKRVVKKLRDVESRDDWDYIKSRVEYYNKLTCTTLLPQDSPTIGHQMHPDGKVYFFDTRRAIRWFDPNLHYALVPGDVTKVPEVPSFVKSRPIHGDNANSVLLKLNKMRHFIFVKDNMPWQEKKDSVLFIGKVNNKEQRLRFMDAYFDNPRCILRAIDRHPQNPAWFSPKMTIWEQLQYKFILALEGNDVASNLKWVMSSNSIAVMPEPTYETWFMEGRLIPDYHYIRIKPDFSDLEERMDYYLQHPKEAQAIIHHANEYVDQFRDNQREEILEILVAKKYFEKTNTLY